MKFHASSMGVIALSTTLLAGGCAISPVAITAEEISAGTEDRLARLTRDQEPLSGTVDLYEAMARALKYNLDQKVEIYETALRTAELDLAHYNMLPNAVASSGYAIRDNVAASSSLNLVTRVPNFGYSTSQDQRTRTADLTFSWSVLDFGLSYVRARQAADKALIAEESRRKVVHRLMEDVRTAYWRAYSAQALSKKLAPLERRTKVALAGAAALAGDRATSPITAMTYRRELIEIQRILRELQRELAIAKFQLAALMNVTPGTSFTLAAPAAVRSTPAAAVTPDDMIRIALDNRPELRDVEYKKRINTNEAHAALLELLPSIQLYAAPNFDSNSYLQHHSWLGWGAKASWNLLKVFQYPARRTLIEGQEHTLDQRALALTMAIMTQIHVGRARVGHYRRELETAKDYHEVQQGLVRAIRAEHAADKVSEQTLLREELNAAVGQIRLDLARSGLETAHANLMSSLGLDPRVEGLTPASSVSEIANALRQGGPIPAGAAKPLAVAEIKE